MTDPQGLHRSVFSMDNLHVLRAMNNESVDLIYLDPPFNSNKTYSAPIGSKAAGAAFKDAWTLSDVDLLEHNRLKVENETLYALIYAAGKAHSKGMFSYLMMMAPRLLEMHRVLKTTGSLFLHCDPAASHYLKIMMDAIFRHKSFRSEIVWRRVNPTGRGKRRLANNADRLLYYAKGARFIWNPQYRPHEPDHVAKAYRYTDGAGRRFMLGDLKGAGTRTGSSGQPWRGIDPNDTGSHWAVPNRALPEDCKALSSQEKLDILDGLGRIYWPPKGGMPRYKRYMDEMPGTPIDTLWGDIGQIQAKSSERVGYPTQKPVALLERIIKASSNEGDLVLDPFCGCATAMVAAEGLGRKWVGIDLSPLAAELVVQRIKENRNLFSFRDIQHRETIPIRTDVERRMASTPQERRDLKNLLFLEQEGRCNLCHHEFPEVRHFEMDHIFPRAKGGKDWEDNFQLLCGSCNSIKSTRTQEEARAALVERRGIDFTPFEGGGSTPPLPAHEARIARAALRKLTS